MISRLGSAIRGFKSAGDGRWALGLDQLRRWALSFFLPLPLRALYFFLPLPLRALCFWIFQKMIFEVKIGTEMNFSGQSFFFTVK